MSEPYLGEIRMFGGNFAPRGWMFCDGTLLAVTQYDALFTLIGTTYGGDGRTTFKLPDLRGRLPIHVGGGLPLGKPGGAETVTLQVAEIPSHTHAFVAETAAGSQTSPAGNLPAQSLNVTPFINDVPSGNFNAAAIGSDGGGQSHDNLQPFLCVNFIISFVGIFPTRG